MQGAGLGTGSAWVGLAQKARAVRHKIVRMCVPPPDAPDRVGQDASTDNKVFHKALLSLFGSKPDN